MDLRISELPDGTPPQGGDEIPVNRAGVNFKLLVSDLAASGVHAADDGTAANPAHTFSSELTLGMYKAAAGVLAFAALGAERVRITTAGITVQGLTGQLGFTGAGGTADTGLKRSSAGWLQVTDGSTGIGSIRAGEVTLFDTTNSVIAMQQLRLALASGKQVVWTGSATDAASAAADVGLGRGSAGFLQVTNGAAGNGGLEVGTAGFFRVTATAGNATTIAQPNGADNSGFYIVPGNGSGHVAIFRRASTVDLFCGLSSSGITLDPGSAGVGTGHIKFNTTGSVVDAGLARHAAGLLRITNGSTGYGRLTLSDGTYGSVPAIAFQNGAAIHASATPAIVLGTSGTGWLVAASGGVGIPSTGQFLWSSGAIFAAGNDTGLKRSAAGIVETTDGSTGMGTMRAFQFQAWTLQGGTGNNIFVADSNGAAVDAGRQFLFSSTSNNASASKDAGIGRVTAGVVRVTNGTAGGVAQFLAAKRVVAITGVGAASGTDAGTIYTNEGDTDGAILNLPDNPSYGQVFEFAVIVAQAFDIVPGAGESIRDGASTGSTKITSNTIGSTLKLVAVTAGAGAVWMVMAKNGTWTVS